MARKFYSWLLLWSSNPDRIFRFVVEYTKLMAPHIKVIGSAGSAEKVEIMKSIGVDVAFNYKTEDTNEILKKHGPIDMCAFPLSFTCFVPDWCWCCRV